MDHAQRGEVVRDLLLRGEAVRELADDAARDGDVDLLHLDAERLREALDDGQQRVGGEVGRLVALSVQDLVQRHLRRVEAAAANGGAQRGAGGKHDERSGVAGASACMVEIRAARVKRRLRRRDFSRPYANSYDRQ